MNAFVYGTLIEIIDAEAEGQENIPVVHIFAIAFRRGVIENRTQIFFVILGRTI